MYLPKRMKLGRVDGEVFTRPVEQKKNFQKICVGFSWYVDFKI